MSAAKSIIRDVVPAEYEKIRKFVIGQIWKAGSRPMRLSSNREIAKLFGVSQPTVVKAMKDLIADGYLKVKPGVGVFTNPGKPTSDVDGSILIGVLNGGGKPGLIGSDHWYEANFIEAVMRRSSKFLMQRCFLSYSSGDEDGFAKELATLGFDALMVFGLGEENSAALRKLKEDGLPIVTVGLTNYIPGVSGFHLDFAADNRAAAGAMLDEGRRRLLLVQPDGDAGKKFMKDGIAGFQEAFAARGLPYSGSAVMLGRHDVAKLKEAVSSIKPEGVVFNQFPASFWLALRECVDVVDRCRVYCGFSSVFDDMDYVGYVGTPDLGFYAKRAADNLAAQLRDGAAAPVLDETMKLKISYRRAAQ